MQDYLNFVIPKLGMVMPSVLASYRSKLQKKLKIENKKLFAYMFDYYQLLRLIPGQITPENFTMFSIPLCNPDLYSKQERLEYAHLIMDALMGTRIHLKITKELKALDMLEFKLGYDKRFQDGKVILRYIKDNLPLETKEEKEHIAYTDGSCINGVSGAGVFFGNGDSKNMSSSVPGNQTNQRAEVWAAVLALRATSGTITIKTDSLYLIHCATKKWKLKSNYDLFESLWKEMKDRNVQFIHVKAHSGIYGNEQADTLAKRFVQSFNDVSN
jgi:ribonuclease HI